MQIIDFINDAPESIYHKFNSIQKRYFDPLSLRLLTDTKKYVFVEEKFNKYTSLIYGNNKRLYGLKIEEFNININNNRLEITLSPGAIISDGVIIEFTDTIKLIQKIKISDSNYLININNNEPNFIFIQYKYIKSFPPNIAYIKILSKTKIEEEIHPEYIKGILGYFKLNNNNLTEIVPEINCPSNNKLIEYCISPEKSKITLFNNNFIITPPFNKEYIEKGILELLTELKNDLAKYEIDIYSYLLKHEEKLIPLEKFASNYTKINNFEKSITINRKTSAPYKINLLSKFPELNQINKSYLKNCNIEIYLNGIKLISNNHYYYDRDNLTVTIYYPKNYLTMIY